MEWPQTWARRLEFVLNDRAALDMFHEWLRANHNHHPLELHFALRSFERMANERDERASELAKIIYETYISARTGVCSFFSSRTRNDVALRVRSLSPDNPADSNLFEPLLFPLDTQLRALHEAFVSSDHFIEIFNQFSTGGGEERRRRKQHSERERYGTQLTAEALLKSRDVREHAESSVERMFACPARPPYVGRATTSQNDSAVSSSFSGDGRHRLRSIREEQLRAQPQTFTVPRVDHWRDNDTPDHSTEEGRRHFAEKVAKKLQKEYNKRRRHDDTERKLRDIEEKCTAQEEVRDTIRMLRMDTDVQEEDEDDVLDIFLERMGNFDSVKGSAQRSPRGERALLSPSEWRREPQRSVERREMTNSFSRQPQSYSMPYKERQSGSHCSGSRQAIYDSSGIESNAPSGFSNASRTSRSSAQRRSAARRLLTISYKGPDGVPVVAHVPSSTGTLTLKEFRRQFSISSHDPVQFFFKTYCEDGSAPYQLLLVSEDTQLLPSFEGRVTAELKSRSPQ